MPSRAPGTDARIVDEAVLLARYHETRDPVVREELVQRFLPLARRIAARFSTRPDSLEDLRQVAAIGLLKAIDRYDPARGTTFSTYAVPTISGEIKRYFRDRAWSVRPPRELQERALRVEAAATRLTDARRRAPTVAELAEHLDDDEERVLEALYAQQAQFAASMQAQSASPDGAASRLEERLGAEDRAYEAVDERILVERLLRGVSSRERRVLRLHFELDMTQRDIGKVLGVSQMQVSRIIRHALGRMHTIAAARSDELAPACATTPRSARTTRPTPPRERQRRR